MTKQEQINRLEAMVQKLEVVVCLCLQEMLDRKESDGQQDEHIDKLIARYGELEAVQIAQRTDIDRKYEKGTYGHWVFYRGYDGQLYFAPNDTVLGWPILATETEEELIRAGATRVSRRFAASQNWPLQTRD